MTIRVALHHRTKYAYDRLVNLGPQVVRLRPAPHCRTPITAYSLKVTPETHFCNWQQDPQSNYQARLVFPEKTREFVVDVDLVAEMTVVNPFDFFLEEAAEKFPFEYDESLAREIAPFREKGPATPEFLKYLAAVPRDPVRSIDFLWAMNARLQKDIKYLIRLEPGVQSPEETLAKKSGSCRDSAWLQVQLLRHLGFAARFVSGYLIQLTADVKSLDGPSGPEADFTDLHAWTEVYLPGAGWIGLDPTSGLFAGEGHIPLAATPEPQSAAPISGAVDECEVEFGFEMTVTRIHEDPRVTKPYTAEQWASIESLGHRVDADLRRGDVRLTMGGEPTFVSIDDMDGAEWNTLAMGPKKRILAGDLIKRLHGRFAPGGLLHYGQGKWYPGESLPRFALACYWRKDGQPVWNDPSLIANEAVDYGHTEREARRFIHELARELGVTPEHSIPAWEDIWYYLWRERRLPVNVDPLDSRLDEKEERATLARVFGQGLDKIVGYALPLGKGVDGWGAEWMSGAWFFRQERMYLHPGDSPMGLRLPLDSLAWVAPVDRPLADEADAFLNRGELPKPGEFGYQQRFATAGGGSAARSTGGTIEQRFGSASGPGKAPRHPLAEHGGASEFDRVPSQGESAPWVIRTAACAEARHGRLHLFMPPVRRLDDYLELVSAVESTAKSLGMPVIVEGYTPPSDSRLNVLKVTPDPGVIEVNIQPAHSWDELVGITKGLYEDAHQSRLGTEKFMLDGRHTGTGGGNHIVIGGPSPAESPILRRPDLLRSLIGYWHNHPSLSYLFSGMFVGPTSQAPRVDEARNDAVFELETAFRQIPDHGNCPPWMIDRILRHILTDLTGNTHRAEFCIDKLYAPESATGRLGLVEFRGFEMPPHSEMSLTQQLLLRALVARFWEKPYHAELARWGTELHDRFLLPHFVWQDFGDVIAELREHGYAFDRDWFAPHLEFRFPVCGTIEQRDLNLEVRQAIEPWHVLGEEPGGGGTVRYVDSSVERVQVKVTGAVDARHAVLCNGSRVPLTPTGTNGEYVAGVRYRAWQPPSCLHPTIGVHTPLVFDIVDRWAKRSIGGCTYHVAHPGGRSHDQFPVNAYEAEARRIARFSPFGHTPGELPVPPVQRHPEFPMTLDLRTESLR